MADDFKWTPRAKWTASPSDEAAIRADERFRMALFAADQALHIRSQPLPLELKELLFDLFKAFSGDMMISGGEYSESFELLPANERTIFEQRQAAIEKAARERRMELAAEELARNAAAQAPLYDERDLLQKGQYVQLELSLDEPEDDGSGNNSGGGYLN